MKQNICDLLFSTIIINQQNNVSNAYDMFWNSLTRRVLTSFTTYAVNKK